jgi:predicted DNA-binding protein
VRLSHPTHIRLTTEQLQRLDSWRGDRMNRATAIRLLLEQALRLQLDEVLPANR